MISSESLQPVLYEMLAGRASFAGETVTDIIAAVVTREPEWAALPAATPASMRSLLARCLEKDPKRRVRDIGDVRLEIEETLARGSSDATGTEQLAATAPVRSVWRALPWMIATAAVSGGVHRLASVPRPPRTCSPAQRTKNRVPPCAAATPDQCRGRVPR